MLEKLLDSLPLTSGFIAEIDRNMFFFISWQKRVFPSQRHAANCAVGKSRETQAQRLMPLIIPARKLPVAACDVASMASTSHCSRASEGTCTWYWPAMRSRSNWSVSEPAIALQKSWGYSLWAAVRNDPLASLPIATSLGGEIPSGARLYIELAKLCNLTAMRPVGFLTEAPHRHCPHRVQFDLRMLHQKLEDC